VKNSFALVLALAAAPLFAQPEIPFDSTPDFFKYPSEMNLGEMASVAVNSKGHIFMLSRSNVTGPLYGAIATQVLEFDKNGNYLREIGKGLYGFGYAHSVRFDKYDNLWVVDKGTNMIMKFNQAGHVSMVLGRKEEAPDEHEYRKPGAPPPHHVDNYYNQPTDVAWDSADNIYISGARTPASSTRPTTSGSIVKTTSMSRTAGTPASRYSIRTAIFCGPSRSTFRLRPAPASCSATRRRFRLPRGPWLPVRRGPSASPRVRPSISIPTTRFQAGSTN
jgi:hypothetical protein